MAPRARRITPSTTSSLGVSTATASTRTWRRCSRTRITSEAIEALLDRDHDNHRSQQGLHPYTGTLNHAAPHEFAKAPFVRYRSCTDPSPTPMGGQRVPHATGPGPEAARRVRGRL